MSEIQDVAVPMKEPVVIVGAGGFVGRHLVRRLVGHCQVIATVRHIPEDAGHTQGETWLQCDLTDDAMAENLPRSAGTVIHLAQSRHFSEFPDQARDIFGVNVAGTYKLLEWAVAAGAQKFIFTSSGGIYGTGPVPFSESAPFKAEGELGFYLASKYCGESLVHGFSSLFVPVVLRPFFVYGPGQGKTALIQRLIRRIAAGEPVRLAGPHGIRINPLHVIDAVGAILRAAELPAPATINIAGPETLAMKEIALILGRHLSREPKFVIEEGETGKDMVADIATMGHLLGAPSVRFHDGAVELCRVHAE